MTREAGVLSDAQVQDRLRGVQRRSVRDVEDSIRSLMAEDWGRRFVYWLLFEQGRLQAASFSGATAAIKDGICASMHMAYVEGQRSVAMDLANEVQRISPERYLTMMHEQIRVQQGELSIEMEAQEHDE